jgi:hypothetical protein
LSIQLFLTFPARVPMLSSWVLHRTHTIHLPVYMYHHICIWGVALSLTNLELMQ